MEVRSGSLTDPGSLKTALAGVTHVLHCAGKTKAVDRQEYWSVNTEGTRHVVQAIAGNPAVQRLVLISSLAAAGPGTRETPALEDGEPRPVSEYGRSKLAGEVVVRDECTCEHTILRPSGVYGPGDSDFLELFRAVRWHVRPTFGRGRQPLNLVYVDDLADIAVACLTLPPAAGRTVNVAHPEIVDAFTLGKRVAEALQVRAIPLRLPAFILPWLCRIQDAQARRTGKPGILSVERSHELSAPGWVCDTRLLREQLGLQCPTAVQDGLRRTADWYRAHGWL